MPDYVDHGHVEQQTNYHGGYEERKAMNKPRDMSPVVELLTVEKYISILEEEVEKTGGLLRELTNRLTLGLSPDREENASSESESFQEYYSPLLNQLVSLRLGISRNNEFIIYLRNRVNI